ncbi:MAG: cytochrome c family protein [Hydrocarboniphaga sp.]|uniref:cytochrome-c peroxidase n=1 Tax=Hydrocarboniphaga sp. TaxID=2033016 RepID=UPI002620411A|nr:cytochrome c peroxidase [Hydrocarboniphaga sp.]MDB5972873.1 cytochrome c family protein [Hydrocarboniphaga sp.]
MKRYVIATLLVLAACTPDKPPVAEQAKASATDQAFYAQKFSKKPEVPAMTALGREMFFDDSLSASGKLACASCHDPAQAYGPPDSQPVRFGGADQLQTGFRAAPSLRYLQSVPPFTEHYYEEDDDDSLDQGAAGGRTWDGRAHSAHEQAMLPLLSAQEMANADAAAVVAKLRAAPYAAQFRDTFGDDVFDDGDRAWRAALLALEVFQQSPADFYPYDSKYDGFLRHQVELSAQELRGLKLFEAQDKGNCASCHPNRIRSGALPTFTDFGYVALGVPRNAGIPANGDAGFHDLGLCGPLRKDLADRAEYCGRFRTPSLRNVALRKTYFHNGAYATLREAVDFYARRDVQPQHFYPRDRDGKPSQFDDLPEAYRGNVNMDPPFGGKPGGKPALSESEIDDLIAFLGTLSDGYKAP